MVTRGGCSLQRLALETKCNANKPALCQVSPNNRITSPKKHKITRAAPTAHTTRRVDPDDEEASSTHQSVKFSGLQPVPEPTMPFGEDEGSIEALEESSVEVLGPLAVVIPIEEAGREVPPWESPESRIRVWLQTQNL